MGETPSTFSPSFNASVVIEARPERLTSDAGAVMHDPRQPHLVTYRNRCDGAAYETRARVRMMDAVPG